MSDQIDPELLRRFYVGYLECISKCAILSRIEGAFDRANLYEEILHQWKNMNFVTNLQEFPGLFSAYLQEMILMYPQKET
jgi:hypothetical protein